MQRRQFLASTVRIALGASAAQLLSGSLSAQALAESKFENFSEPDARTLSTTARAMFPHRDLDDSYYLAVVQTLDSLSAEQRESIANGLTQLNAATEGSWLDASVDDKLRALEELQDEPFFRLVLNTTIDVLYRHPDVWKLVGYQGSSIEHGGYLDRGFDDIDWLP